MTTESGETPNERKQNQQPRERGGVAGDDRSKHLSIDDSPLGSPKKDTAEPKKEESDR